MEIFDTQLFWYYFNSIVPWIVLVSGFVLAPIGITLNFFLPNDYFKDKTMGQEEVS